MIEKHILEHLREQNRILQRMLAVLEQIDANTAAAAAPKPGKLASVSIVLGKPQQV